MRQEMLNGISDWGPYWMAERALHPAVFQSTWQTSVLFDAVHGFADVLPKIFKNILFIFIHIFLFLDRGKERENRMERNIDWLPVVCALTGTNPSTQACALTRNRTRDLSLCGKTPSLHLSHTGQGCCKNLMMQTSTPK